VGDAGARLARAAGDGPALLVALTMAGVAALSLGQPALAAERLAEGVALGRGIDAPALTGLALTGQAWVAAASGEVAQAEALLIRSEALLRHAGSGWILAVTLNSRAMLLAGRGETAAMAALLRESLALSRRLGDTQPAGYALEGLAGAALAAGGLERAARLFGAAEGLHARTGSAIQNPTWQSLCEGWLTALRARLDPAALAAAWAAGRAMPPEAALKEALEEAV
jgi:hypothetical protein